MILLFINWFFIKAPAEILVIGENFLAWGWNFFSIGYLLPRLFSPWHKDLTSYGRGFDLERFLQIFGWNFISRFIGAVMRLAVIIIGLATEIGLFFWLIVLLLFWYVLPLVVVFLFFHGSMTLFL